MFYDNSNELEQIADLHAQLEAVRREHDMGRPGRTGEMASGNPGNLLLVSN